MAPEESTLAKRPSSDLTHSVDPAQTLRAATALLHKIQSDQASRTAAASKTDLLADADDDDEPQDGTPIWLIITTKKYIIDKKRLKPGKILLPHPYLNTTANSSLRICLITADPQRKYKDLIAESTFPLELAKRVSRVIGITKLKAKYKSFESRRQLLGEYDVFLADDRIITHLPSVLGKVFYKGGSKRPVPVTLEGRRQNLDEQGNKRVKLSEGGTKVVKSEVKPAHIAHEIERALSSALVHLAPSTTTAVKVGSASSMKPEQIQANVEAVTKELVEKYVPQKWTNVRAVHIKGPDTAALPIWLAEELWQDEKDVLEQAPPVKLSKKRKRQDALEKAAVGGANEAGHEVIEVPGPDGKMRRLVRSSSAKGNGAVEPASAARIVAQTPDEDEEAVMLRMAGKAEKAIRKKALQKQKVAAKAAVVA